jgi:hypothetical protein
MNAVTAERALSKQTAAAKALRDTLATLAGDDPELIRDSIEGETDLHEAVAMVSGQIREDEILCLGLSGMIATLEARKHRLEERMGRCRAAIEQALLIGEVKTLALPDATISLKNVPPTVEIINESEIPSEFWKPRDPTLDRPAIKAALKDGRPVPGATLGNGSITISIRRQ